MHRYIIKRLIMLIPVLLGVAFIIFAIMSVAEGDPVYSVAGPDATEEELDALREEMGLNGSLIERYFRYIGKLLRGNLGTSYISQMDVMKLYLQRLPNTLRLASLAMVVAILMSVPLGIIAAVNQNSWKDTIAMILALVGLSMPNFWLGLLLMLLFSLKLGWFPSGGSEGALSVVLPAVTVGVGLAALLTRTTRSSMLDVLRQDYLRTARARGSPRERSSCTTLSETHSSRSSRSSVSSSPTSSAAQFLQRPYSHGRESEDSLSMQSTRETSRQ